MRRFAWVLVFGALIAALLYAFRAPLSTRLVERVAIQRMTADPVSALPDGIHVVLCGAGSPLPDPQRSGPCVAVVAGGKLYVVDAGSGAARNLLGMNLPPGAVEAVFLTHFHSDHIDGLGELALQRWVGGSHEQPLPLVGPTGVDRIARGFNTAYEPDRGYRVAHHGEQVVPSSGAGFDARPYPTPSPGSEQRVWEEGGLRVSAFRVEHPPIDPAVGYRFDYGGRSVVISGDTRKSVEIERMARDVDLLVHEALAPQLVRVMERAALANGMQNRAKIMADILDYLASPVEAAQSAQTAGARHLLFYHVVPPLLVPGLQAAFLEGVANAYSGDVSVGRDGTRVWLPPDSSAIEVSGES